MPAKQGQGAPSEAECKWRFLSKNIPRVKDHLLFLGVDYYKFPASASFQSVEHGLQIIWRVDCEAKVIGV
eukprot:1160804-Pelagomonas_calceolata.AAC.1